MGEVIQFPGKKKEAATPVVAVVISGGLTQDERMERIRATLQRINELMTALKQTERRLDE